MNRYEIKEIQASDLEDFFVRCDVGEKGSLLFRKLGSEGEVQLIPGDYDKLIKSEHFLVCMARYLLKTGCSEHLEPIIKWHDYHVHHTPGMKEPDDSFSLFDVWELELGEIPDEELITRNS